MQIEIVSVGISPDVYLAKIQPLARVDAAFSIAFGTPSGSVFRDGEDFERFLETSKHNPAALLYELDRPNYKQKLNIYTDPNVSILNALIEFSYTLGTAILVDLRKDDTDSYSIFISPTGETIAAQLSETEPTFGDGSRMLSLTDGQGKRIEVA